MGATYRVELRRGSLSYTKLDARHRNPKPAIITPTAAQWSKFRQVLDELSVWRWRSEYPNTGTRDGTQWALELAYSDRALKTRGDNNYPGATGRPNESPRPTKAFDVYLAAVEKLLNGRTFR